MIILISDNSVREIIGLLHDAKTILSQVTRRTSDSLNLGLRLHDAKANLEGLLRSAHAQEEISDIARGASGPERLQVKLDGTIKNLELIDHLLNLETVRVTGSVGDLTASIREVVRIARTQAESAP